MRQLFQKILGGVKSAASKDDAKQRLKVLLVHDQVDLSPGQMEQMKEEILEVVRRYCDIDASGVDVRLDREQGHVSLVSSVPVRRVSARAS